MRPSEKESKQLAAKLIGILVKIFLLTSIDLWHVLHIKEETDIEHLIQGPQKGTELHCLKVPASSLAYLNAIIRLQSCFESQTPAIVITIKGLIAHLMALATSLEGLYLINKLLGRNCEIFVQILFN